MRHTFAGLGASRAEVEKLLLRPAERNEFILNFTQKNPYGAGYSTGKFSWDATNVHFDFYGKGKLRRITVPWVAIDENAEQHLQFCPKSRADRWTGVATEFAGTAHREAETELWERHGWNTVNEWCGPLTYQSIRTSIGEMKRISEQAWARITEDNFVWYLMPGPEGRRADIGSDKYFTAHFSRSTRWFEEPSWTNFTNLTPDQRAYLEIAFDQWESSGGKSFAPLRGIELKPKKRRKS